MGRNAVGAHRRLAAPAARRIDAGTSRDDPARDALRRVTRTARRRHSRALQVLGAAGYFATGMLLWIGGTLAWQVWQTRAIAAVRPAVRPVVVKTPVQQPAENLAQWYVAAADRILDDYRTSAEPRLYQFDWQKAEICLERAGALQGLEDGHHVALVSGGDPGVFAMAAAVFEAIDEGELSWRGIDVAVSPGISAMHAAAARAGAPLGHDFCAISLSDNLKPWPLIEKRLVFAANADFVIALYNPASAARPRRIHEAFALLRGVKLASTPVIFAHAVGRQNERISIETLAGADPGVADMSTLIIVGSSETRIVPRGAGAPFVYTSRGVKVHR